MRHALIVVGDGAFRFSHRSPGHRLARALRDTETWTVEVCDRGAETKRYDIVAAVRRLAASLHRPDGKPAVFLFGDTASQRHAAWEIVKAGLRPQTILVLHPRVGEVPLSRAAAELLALADLVVVESRFGARAVRACLREARTLREPRIAVLPPACAEAVTRRDAPRAETASDAPFRVGCVLEPYSERGAFLALQIFRAFADGHYSVCGDCGFVTPWGEASEHFEPVPSSRCMRCRSERGRRGRAWPATLRVVAFPTPRLDEPPQKTWDFPTLRGVLGLSGRVLVEGEEGFPILATEADWLDCLASFHAHLSVGSSAGIDAAALATCALGVPTLRTRFGASAEILEGRAQLVEARELLLDPAGHWRPVMDVGSAASALAAIAAARSTQCPNVGHGPRPLEKVGGGLP